MFKNLVVDDVHNEAYVRFWKEGMRKTREVLLRRAHLRDAEFCIGVKKDVFGCRMVPLYRVNNELQCVEMFPFGSLFVRPNSERWDLQPEQVAELEKRFDERTRGLGLFPKHEVQDAHLVGKLVDFPTKEPCFLISTTREPPPSASWWEVRVRLQVRTKDIHPRLGEYYQARGSVVGRLSRGDAIEVANALQKEAVERGMGEDIEEFDVGYQPRPLIDQF